MKEIFIPTDQMDLNVDEECTADIFDFPMNGPYEGLFFFDIDNECYNNIPNNVLNYAPWAKYAIETEKGVWAFDSESSYVSWAMKGDK